MSRKVATGRWIEKSKTLETKAAGGPRDCEPLGILVEEVMR